MTALRAELDARKLAPRAVALGLPRASVTVKPIDFPLVSGNMREMVRFELERHVPFPADDAAFDFTLVPANVNGSTTPGTRRVLVAGADRRVVESALRIADEAQAPDHLGHGGVARPALAGQARAKAAAPCGSTRAPLASTFSSWQTASS